MNIKDYLDKFNYDIRITNDARFMDQKVTPDVLCIIADCILQFSGDEPDREFTAKQIWESDYANANVKDIFNKPDVFTSSAKSEYDKFFAQPLKMLAYSKVIKCEVRGNRNYFKIQNKGLLNFISIKERNSLIFLVEYLEKVLRDSGIWNYFDDFFNNNDKNHFNILKSSYEDFIIINTPINGKTEVRRIFTKIINPLSYIRKLHGTRGGFYSTDIIGYDELMYNRRNWRDIKKQRGETRQEYENRAKHVVEKSKRAFVELTKNKIRKHHNAVSELRDDYFEGLATQVHHIFPASDFPQLDSILENLILLTPTQHFSYAHPSNNTRIVDSIYQYKCLLAKSLSIQKSLHESDGFYSKEDFVYVLNIGINPVYKFSSELSLSEIEDKISDEYNISL